MPPSARTAGARVSPAASGTADALRAAMNAARKAQDKDRTLVLGTILAKIRREAIEQYQAGGRTDLAEAEQAQIAVLEEFLPPAVDPEEIRAAVREVIAGGAKDLGKVMGQIVPRYKGRADGKLINQIVREELQAG
jgi:uncharacterized protein YqeY